jgi:hypothetical protein
VVELSKLDWDCREDYGKDKAFPNTDGCSLISQELCGQINATLTPLGFRVSTENSVPLVQLFDLELITHRNPKLSRSASVASKAWSTLEQAPSYVIKSGISKCF